MANAGGLCRGETWGVISNQTDADPLDASEKGVCLTDIGTIALG